MEPSQCQHSSVDEFVIVKSLGSGLHAKVKLATHEGKQYAIKIFKPDTADLSNLEHELGILKTLDHPNIIKLKDVRPNATYRKKSGKTRQALVIILEYASGGELFDYVAMCGRFPTEIARTYFHMLIDALSYIHGQGICHRDIKPENILLDNEFRLRLADFGFATFLKRGTLTTKLGTEGYMAPEIRSKNYKGQKVDLFAAGIILFVMFAGGPPFEKAVPNDPYYKVFAAKQYNIFWGAHAKRKPNNFFTDDFKDLINRMLCLKPEERIDIEGVRNHPWFRGDVLFLNDMRQELINRKTVIDQKKQEQAASSGSSESRSGLEKPSLETILEIKKDIGFDEKAMVKTFESVGNKDLVLQTDAETFVAQLKYMLTHNEGNRLFINQNEDAPPVTEIYEVTANKSKQTVDIRLTHNQIETNVQCLIRLKLGYDQNKNLVVKFIRELDESEQEQPFDYLLSIRLMNYIKDTLRIFSA